MSGWRASPQRYHMTHAQPHQGRSRVVEAEPAAIGRAARRGSPSTRRVDHALLDGRHPRVSGCDDVRRASIGMFETASDQA